MKSEAQIISEVKTRLAPDRIWKLRDRMELLLRDVLSRLPRGKVSENEERYPTSLQGVRPFPSPMSVQVRQLLPWR